VTQSRAESPLFHQVQGEGEPLLLLNGVMMSALAWGRCAEVIAQRMKVITCDFRGQLMTPGPAHARIGDNAGDVVALLDHLGLERVHVVGTSFGASVGVYLALEAPERVSSFVPVAGAAYADETLQALESTWGAKAREAAEGGSRRALFETIFESVYAPGYLQENQDEIEKKLSQLEAMPQTWFEELVTLMGSARDYDARGVIDQIRCPTLVIAAEHDEIIPVARARELADAIPGAAFEVMPRVGHGAVFERPIELAARVLRFASGLT
jgi:pimeloyl-ACP methyl ester carboxylesterase